MTRTAVVTIANRGLGRATTLTWARRKINVVVASRGGSSTLLGEP